MTETHEDGPVFAHASEAEMARILDFYAVRWAYEPDTFPILWNLEGNVIESFSPDFWLPDLDIYLEMTTLRQRLVRRKNRKLRRLRELYPDIRVKLFYARDFRALMLKYGKLALVDALSGTPGQVPSRRPAAPLLVIAEEMPDPPIGTVGAPIIPPLPGTERLVVASAADDDARPNSSPRRRGAGRRARRRHAAERRAAR